MCTSEWVWVKYHVVHFCRAPNRIRRNAWLCVIARNRICDSSKRVMHIYLCDTFPFLTFRLRCETEAHTHAHNQHLPHLQDLFSIHFYAFVGRCVRVNDDSGKISLLRRQIKRPTSGKKVRKTERALCAMQMVWINKENTRNKTRTYRTNEGEKGTNRFGRMA